MISKSLVSANACYMRSVIFTLNTMYHFAMNTFKINAKLNCQYFKCCNICLNKTQKKYFFKYFIDQSVVIVQQMDRMNIFPPHAMSLKVKHRKKREIEYC